MIEADELTLSGLFDLLEGGQQATTSEQRKRGRPRLSAAPKTAAQRQRERRARLALASLKDPSQWDDAECIAVLSSGRHRGTDLDELAWHRLGELRDFL